MTKPQSTYSQTSRERLRETGAKRISVWLITENVETLDALMNDSGKTYTDIINDLIARSRFD